MKSLQAHLNSWSGGSSLPKLNDRQWQLSTLVGVVFLVMALLQVIGFSDFKNALDGIGLSSSPTLWAVLIIVVEVWGSLSFFKIRLNNLGRTLSNWFALLVSGFWFYETLKLVSEGAAGQLPNSGFFGKYLQQSPGWWTVVEASALLAFVLYLKSAAAKNK